MVKAWLSKVLSFFFDFPEDWSEEKRRKSYLTTLIYIFFSLFLVLALLIRIVYVIFVVRDHNSVSLLSLALFSSLFIHFLFLIRKRGSKLSASFLIISLLVLCFQGSLQWGIDLFTIDIIYPLIIFLAAVLVSSNFSFLILFVEILGLTIIFYLQSNNLVVWDPSWKNYDSTYFDLIMILAVYFLMAAFSWLSTREIEKSLKRALKEEAKNKKLLEKLKYQNLNLEKIVEERTTDLKNYQLEQLIKVSPFVDMGKLAAGIIHNIRTPLAVISLALDNLLAKGANLNPDLYQEHLLKAKNATETISDFSKVSKNQFSENQSLDYFDLNQEIEKIIQLFDYKAKNRSIKIFFNSNKKYKLMAYREKLDQVIANLLLNAIEAFENSDKSDKHIFIKLERNKHYLLIQVKDYATGISKENLKDLFKARFTTKSEKDGLGLGLYFCQEIMQEFYETKIKIESVLGEGSVFTLRIKNKYILNPNGKKTSKSN